MGKTTLTLSKAELSDLNEILELQKEAYIQEARIYNNFDIHPLTQKLDSLAAEWRNGIVIKAETNGQIVGSVRAQLVDHVFGLIRNNKKISRYECF